MGDSDKDNAEAYLTAMVPLQSHDDKTYRGEKKPELE
jgi:hypothetical protein